MRRVTFSKSYTLSLSRTCACYCKYCSFATRTPDLRTPDEVVAEIDEAASRGAKELLVLAGERPGSNRGVAESLAELGFSDFVEYVVWACRRALDRGLLPHSNVGVLDDESLLKLREVNASMGLMLESTAERLAHTVHAGSPEKAPGVRMDAIDRAGRLKIPFTSGILIGIGETQAERIESIESLAAVHARHGHLQEVILQNYVRHPRYYGQDVPAMARRSAAERGLERASAGVQDSALGDESMPAWASRVTLAQLKELVGVCRRLMPDVGVQIPPNLSPWWPELVECGATDLGGLSSNGDHISPEEPFPRRGEVQRALAERGFALTERLCVYPRFIDTEWVDDGVLATIAERYPTFGGRNGTAHRRARLSDGALVSGAIARAGRGARLRMDEAEALFAESRPAAIEEIRIAADEMRREIVGETVTYVVNRNINFTNICTVGCGFCGFARSRNASDAFEIAEAAFVDKVLEADRTGATEICMQGGIHPEYGLERYGRLLRLAKDAAPEMHLHAWSPMEIHHMCETSGGTPEYVLSYLIDMGLGSIPGTAAEILDDRVRDRISPNKLTAGRWVEIVEAAHGLGLKSSATVMFGHIEEPGDLALHMGAILSLHERTGGFTEFVPLPFVPYLTRLGRTRGVTEISPEEFLKHMAVFRLVLGAALPNLQASWVKMGLDVAGESLRWGANDLGGTLMEESISKTAGAEHGESVTPRDLVDAAGRLGRLASERTTLYEAVNTRPQAGSSTRCPTGAGAEMGVPERSLVV